MLTTVMAFKLKITKDRIKFSAAHFTIFGEQQAERLHGHNYYISVSVSTADVDALGFCTPMDKIKDVCYELSQELDEFTLIPTQNPYLTFAQSENQVDVFWNKKRYSFPQQDVKLLPVSNITCENLAQWFWENISSQLPSSVNFLEVTVQETHGQEATYAKGILS